MSAADVTRPLIKTIRESQIKFIGHVNRRGGAKKLALCGKLARERQRKTEKDVFQA